MRFKKKKEEEITEYETVRTALIKPSDNPNKITLKVRTVLPIVFVSVYIDNN